MINKEMMSQFSIFSCIPNNHLEEVASDCNVLELKDGDVIFHQHEAAVNIYGVLEGEVELSIVFKERVLKTDISYEESVITRVETREKPIIVDTLGPREIISWSSFVKPCITSATARCVGDTRVFSLPVSPLKALFEKNPSTGYCFMEKLSETISYRLNNRTDKLIESWGEAFGSNKTDMNLERRKSVSSQPL